MTRSAEPPPARGPEPAAGSSGPDSPASKELGPAADQASGRPILPSALLALDAGCREYVAGHDEAAIEHLTEALALDDGLWSARYLLALAYRQAGLTDRAVELFRSVAEGAGDPHLADAALLKLEALGAG